MKNILRFLHQKLLASCQNILKKEEEMVKFCYPKVQSFALHTVSDEERLALQNRLKDEKIDRLQFEKESKISGLEETAKKLLERIEALETERKETRLINSRVKETINRESDPSNPHFPDGGPFDTRLVNLEVEEINADSMVVYDSEFGESINVVLRKNQVYCRLDKSSTCKHVLFALANSKFYEIVKKNDIKVDV